MNGPEDGHQFHFSVLVQASYGITGDPAMHDAAPDPEDQPFTATIRAWSLRDACTLAAALPLDQWTLPDDES